MSNISDYEADMELEYIEPTGSCHLDDCEDVEHT